MHKLLFLIFLSLVSWGWPANAQAQKKGQERIDSLTKAIATAKDDTNKVNGITQLSYALYQTNPDEGMKYALQALDLSKRLSWKTGIADAYHAMGIIYWGKSDYPASLEAYFKSLETYEETKSSSKIASTLGNIALVYTNQKDYKKALEYSEKATAMHERSKDTVAWARNLGNVGNIYKNMKEFDKALEYYYRAIEIDEKKGFKTFLATVLINTADVHTLQSDYAKALPYYLRGLSIHESLGNKRGRVVAMANIAECYRHTAEDSIAKSKPDSLVLQGKVNLLQKSVDYLQQAAALATEIGFLDALYSIENNLAEIYPLMGNYKEGLERYIKFTGLKDSIFSAENQVKIAKLETQREVMLKDKQIEIDQLAVANKQKQVEINQLAVAEKEKQVEIDQLAVTNKDKQIELDKLAVAYQEKLIEADKLAVANKEKQIELATVAKRTERIFYISGIAVLLLILAFILSHYRSQKRSNVLLAREKKKSDDLLLNILPTEVANELKQKGSAEAKNFDHVTILFTDFVNFTGAGERMNSQELIDELDCCFVKFDEIISKYNIEKIKTIGDAYLAVSGLPVPDSLHAENVVHAALEIREFMRNRLKELGDRTFEIRIGIHSGSVVAGIVGVKKFAYDIWGDTVNTAARLEQNSLPDKINISQSTYELVGHKFACDYRGEIEAKNKGQLGMYFLERVQVAEEVAEMAT